MRGPRWHARMTSMTRITRRIAALIAIATLAFAQLAVSAYACSSYQAGTIAHAADSALDQCGKTANLCERHCSYGDSSLQSVPAAAIVPDLAPLPWRVEMAPTPAVDLVVARERPAPTRLEPPP